MCVCVCGIVDSSIELPQAKAGKETIAVRQSYVSERSLLQWYVFVYRHLEGHLMTLEELLLLDVNYAIGYGSCLYHSLLITHYYSLERSTFF